MVLWKIAVIKMYEIAKFGNTCKKSIHYSRQDRSTYFNSWQMEGVCLNGEGSCKGNPLPSLTPFLVVLLDSPSRFHSPLPP